MKKLQPEELFILASAKIEPSIDEIEKLNDLVPLIKKWDYMLKLAIENGMAPLVYKKIPLLSNGSMIPEGVKENLQQMYFKTLSLGTILYQNFNEVVKAFKVEGIEVIPLKGIFLADYLYKDIGLRQLSDIDVLVKEENIPRCIEIMKGLGYYQNEARAEFFNENIDHIHCSHIVKGVAKFDLHRKLHKDDERFYLNINDLWENATEVVVNDVPVLALDIHHHLIYLCIHLEKHFGLEIVHYKCFCDIANILDRYKEHINWNTLENQCNKYNCTEVVFKYLILIYEYFNAFIPEAIIKEHSKKASKRIHKHFIKNFKNKNSWKTVSIAQLRIKKGIISKTKFVFSTTFPPIKFMISRYRIKYPVMLPYYYLLRVGTGINQLLGYFVRKK